ncbi:MAG: dephospho-CoA kinase [Candidatus Omnitrophota bacterium]
MLIGVTGGFCSGKTTVSTFFKQLGAQVIDADKIVHMLYRDNGKVKNLILKEFGKSVFSKKGVDRKRLAAVVLRSRRELKRLCDIVHPVVIREITAMAKRSTKHVVVVDAALLIETKLAGTCDVVVVVKAGLKRRLNNCLNKGYARRDLFKRQALQLPLKEKLKAADHIIDNNGTKSDLKKEAVKIWAKLTKES